MAKPEPYQTEETAAQELPPLEIAPASTWADRKAPPPRDFICEGLGLPACRVTSMIGNGGFGKTTVANQLAIAVATNSPIYGMAVSGGPVLGIFCEDEGPEIERRTRLICEAEGIDLRLLDALYLLSRDGSDNILCAFDHDQIVLTPFYWQLDATVANIRPRLTIIDTAADIFAGDFNSTPHVRQFIKVALGGLCARHETAVLLLAHPSASAIASGDGGGFSTAWNNSVRSRLYLRRPKSDDTDAIADRRVLEIKKANYGPTGATIPLRYERGRFVLDAEPLDECAKPVRVSKADTRLTVGIMAYFKEKAASGQVVAFGAIFEALQATGLIGPGKPETVRKSLQRSLKDLVANGLLRLSNVPRGYRIAEESPP